MTRAIASIAHSRPRGAALLMALLALSVVSAVSVSMLRAGADASLSAHARVQRLECRLLIETLVPHLLKALSEIDRSSEEHPGIGPGLITLLEESSGDARATVRAIDLSGRLHVRSLDSFAAGGLDGSPLQLLRSADFTTTTNIKVDDPPVLEETIAALVSERSGEPVDAFPSRRDGGTNRSADAVAMLVTGYGDGRLNVRTAPMPILEAALHGRDPAASHRLLDLRRAGAPIPDAAVNALGGPDRHAGNAGGQDHDRFVPLTGVSSAVGFIVAIEHPGALRRWWLVAERGQRGSANGWMLRTARRID